MTALPLPPLWAYLGLSGPVWAYLVQSGTIWAHLGLSGHLWAYLGVSGPLWGPSRWPCPENWPPGAAKIYVKSI